MGRLVMVLGAGTVGRSRVGWGLAGILVALPGPVWKRLANFCRGIGNLLRGGP